MDSVVHTAKGRASQDKKQPTEGSEMRMGLAHAGERVAELLTTANINGKPDLSEGTPWKWREKGGRVLGCRGTLLFQAVLGLGLVAWWLSCALELMQLT